MKNLIKTIGIPLVLASVLNFAGCRNEDCQYKVTTKTKLYEDVQLLDVDGDGKVDMVIFLGDKYHQPLVDERYRNHFFAPSYNHEAYELMSPKMRRIASNLKKNLEEFDKAYAEHFSK